MDILMVYWKAALRDAKLYRGRHADTHSSEEVSAFNRSLRRRSPFWRPRSRADNGVRTLRVVPDA